jgi:erythromycin esterase-like protein
MAENTLWSSDLFGENTKVALWAHNGHVTNSRFLGSTGFHLKKELKEKYQILGFAFSLGSFIAVKIENGTFQGLTTHYIKEEPRFGSFNYLCHYAKYDNFILRNSDIKMISFINRWILMPRFFISIGAVFGEGYPYYSLIFYKINFDVMIYWDTTTAAEQLI